MALLTAKVHNYMRAQGAAPKNIEDFLLFRDDPWSEPIPVGRYNAVDLAIIESLRGARK